LNPFFFQNSKYVICWNFHHTFAKTKKIIEIKRIKTYELDQLRSLLVHQNSQQNSVQSQRSSLFFDTNSSLIDPIKATLIETKKSPIKILISQNQEEKPATRTNIKK